MKHRWSPGHMHPNGRTTLHVMATRGKLYRFTVCIPSTVSVASICTTSPHVRLAQVIGTCELQTQQMRPMHQKQLPRKSCNDIVSSFFQQAVLRLHVIYSHLDLSSTI
jgi:hypothetical protein